MRQPTPALLLIMVSLLISACAAPTPTPAPADPTPLTGEAATVPPMPTAGGRPAPFAERVDERERMVETSIASRDVTDPAVLRAMQTVPRHAFVPADYQDSAYNDHPLPIGYGQTISQPYIVALMTQIVQPEADDVVLEIGTGSGYQAAVLAEVVAHVYTVEIVGALAERAQQTFDELGYENITAKHADGYFGWEEYAPFDAIIVTAAPDHVPPPLKDQLADGGRMILPVGPPGGYQELWLVERDGDQFVTTSMGGVAFVPLTRDVREQ